MNSFYSCWFCAGNVAVGFEGGVGLCSDRTRARSLLTKNGARVKPIKLKII